MREMTWKKLFYLVIMSSTQSRAKTQTKLNLTPLLHPFLPEGDLFLLFKAPTHLINKSQCDNSNNQINLVITK